jgi:hypothetical protein
MYLEEISYLQFMIIILPTHTSIDTLHEIHLYNLNCND